MAQESPKSTLDEIQKHLPFLPDWVFTMVLLLALLGGLSALLKNWMPLVHAVKKSLAWVFRERIDKRQVRRLRMFAKHVEYRMHHIGEKEEWNDNRYAELEAELETTGVRSSWWRRHSSNSLRRFSSLTVALEECEERIVLLEGEPGAGKSVAMRHLAQRMAKEAAREPTIIPIYVNLKTFEPAGGEPTADEVRDFVLRSVNQVRDRDVKRFLDDEFQAGLEAGAWLFLFDSFDEIPAILGATEADKVIEAYADALHGFLHGLHHCRGVVASREFRGPGRRSWPTFRVAQLSPERKADLIGKADLDPDVEQALLANLPSAETSVQQMADNPLFLGLLCEHVREGNEFPTNAHAVLETYVGHRLDRDADLVRGYYQTTPQDVRDVAEELAFTMVESLGLTVLKSTAVTLVARHLQRTPEEVDRAIEALKYTKLASTGDDDSTITFSHRRLQEYFATCVVMRDSERVPVTALLTDGRWRETAVTILQTQDVPTLLAEADRLLPDVDQGEVWPAGTLHVLGILADGCPREVLATTDIPRRVGLQLHHAWTEGERYDQKWALECAAVADRDTAVALVRMGFAGLSEWLRQESFAQVGKMPDIAGLVVKGICGTLLDLTVRGQLRKRRASVLSQIRRLPDPARFLPVCWLLLLAPFVNAAVAVGVVVQTWSWTEFAPARQVGVVMFLSAVLPYYLCKGTLLSPSGLRRASGPFKDMDSLDAFRLMLGCASVGLLAFCTTVVLAGTDSEPGSIALSTALVGVMWISGTSATAVNSGLWGPPPLVAVNLLASPVRFIGMVFRRIRMARANWVLATLALFLLTPIGMMGGSTLVEWVTENLATSLLAVMLVVVVLLAYAALGIPMLSRWVQARRATNRMVALFSRGEASTRALRDYFLGIGSIDEARFFLGELREREVVWSDDLVGVVQEMIALAKHDVARASTWWVYDSEVQDLLCMILGDAIKQTLEATHAGRG